MLSGAWGPVADEVRAADAPAPAAPPAPPAASRWTVTGRVVDGWYAGVSGARVAWVADESVGDTSASDGAVTGADGRFRVDGTSPRGLATRGAVIVRRGDAEAAFASVVLDAAAAASDVGDLVLRPAQPLEIVVRSTGRPSPGARVWTWTWTAGPAHGRATFLGAATAGADGRIVFPAWPDTEAFVEAYGADGTTGRARAVWPYASAPPTLPLETSPPRSVTVRVVADTAEGPPVEGAEVRLWRGFSWSDVVYGDAARPGPGAAWPLRTGRDGTVRVDGLVADEAIEFVVAVPGRPRARAECGVRATTATVVVPGPTVVPIVAGEEPCPAAGSRVVVRSWRAAPVEATSRGDALLVPLEPHALHNAVATAPDGSIAVLDRERPTSFAVPRTLVVRFVEPDGRVVPGVGVALGGPVLGAWNEFVTTDGKGRAEFNGLAPRSYRIRCFPNAVFPQGTALDEVDLRDGDDTHDVVLGPERELVLRVTVDGRPELPAHFRWSLDHGVVVGATTDRAAGTLRVRARALPTKPGPAVFEFSAPDVRGSGRRALAWPGPGAVASLDVALVRVPLTTVEIRGAPGAARGAVLEVWDPGQRDAPWVWDADRPFDFAGTTRLRLDRGRYRLMDFPTGIHSTPFDVPESGGAVHAVLDLTALVTIRGRVELPPGTSPEGLALVAEGDGIDTRGSAMLPFAGREGLRLQGTTFELRVPAGRPVRLAAAHPELRPTREGGEVTVVGPRDDVVLRLGAGATVTATLVDAEGKPLAADTMRGFSIVATRVPPASPWFPVDGHTTVEPGRPGGVSASGLPFGPVDLWVKTNRYPVAGLASAYVGRVTLEDDVTDVGEVRLRAGSTVFLRANVGEGVPARAPTSFHATYGRATAQFGPRQQAIRLGDSAVPDVEAEFRHLGAGRWHLDVSGTRSSAAGEEHVSRTFEVDVDGVHDAVILIDDDGFPVPR